MKSYNQTKKIKFKNQVIEYELIIKKQKNIILNFKSGNIVISCPPHVQDWEIERLLYKHAPKLLKVRANYNQNKKIIWEEEDYQFYIFDSFYRIKLLSPGQKTRINNKEIYVSPCKTRDLTIKKLYNFLKIHFCRRFEKKILEWSSKMGLDYKNFSLKIFNAKWGVCYPDKKLIILNIKLIHFPWDVIEYVVIHELAHLIHKNHSKDFWSLVERHQPNYRKNIEILKNPGV